MLLSKDQILAADDQQIERVPVPEWADGAAEAYVCARGLTGDELARLEGKEPDELLRTGVAMGACDDNGHSLGFQPEDCMLLGEKNAAPIRRVWKIIQRLSGLDDDAEATIAKNFREPETGGTGSGSASTTASPSASFSGD